MSIPILHYRDRRQSQRKLLLFSNVDVYVSFRDVFSSNKQHNIMTEPIATQTHYGAWYGGAAGTALAYVAGVLSTGVGFVWGLLPFVKRKKEEKKEKKKKAAKKEKREEREEEKRRERNRWHRRRKQLLGDVEEVVRKVVREELERARKMERSEVWEEVEE
ncbi:hypothetical protein BDV96DRAFT_640580 [Lophiotrema nucula]|uniref:Transmembrane protein n=1 Tax=Lophiotrema nucula TaxID=690887 RepID=A0A6A5ZND1_9PLEO|nr:hypothetical protein BDV96DRAFT_640580 [Lophiotrema nucula]